MKSRASVILIGCAIVLSASYVLTAHATPQSKPQNSAAHWEHLALSHDGTDLGGSLSGQIVRLGNEGWQLVGVTPIAKEGTTVKTVYYFKRSK